MTGLLSLLAVLASGQDGVTATYRVMPREVAVGEPFALVLELEHPADAGVFELSSGELALDDSWVVLGDEHTAPEEIGAGRRRTRRVWTVASLEPGPRLLSDALPVLEGVASVDASATSVDVRSVLAEGEDEPRPIHGLPPGFGTGAPVQETWPWRGASLAAAVGSLLLLSIAVWRRFRRRSFGAERVVTPLERLQRLQAEPATDATRVCARHYDLTRLVREAADAREGGDRGGLTDAEWLATMRGTSLFTPALEDLLSRAEAVKYGGEVPTSWALEEAYASARTALLGLEPDAGGASEGGPR